MWPQPLGMGPGVVGCWLHCEAGVVCSARLCAGPFVQTFDVHVRVKAVWADDVDTHLVGDDEAVAGLLDPFTDVSETEAALFRLLVRSGAVFSHARQARPGARAGRQAAPGSQCRPAAEDVVELWLEGRTALTGDGPLAEHFSKLRALHGLLPELRGGPYVSCLAQVALRNVYRSVTGECRAQTVLVLPV